MSDKETTAQIRLDTWKSIASYLARTVRTVQRWHAEYALPVHHIGGEKSSVFAFISELDKWLENRGHEATPTILEIPHPLGVNRHVIRKTSDCSDEILDPSLIPDSMKTRSKQLVVLSEKMWETLSYSNISMIAAILREAIDLDRCNAAAFVNMSFTLIVQGLWGCINLPFAYAAAQTALQTALEIDPDVPFAKCTTAWLSVVLKHDLVGARHKFDECLKHQPQCVRSIAGRAMLHIAEGHLEKAFNLLQKPCKSNCLNTPLVVYCSWINYLMGKYAQVLDHLDQVVLSDRPEPLIGSLAGLSAIQINEPGLYIPQMEAIAEKYPNHSVLRGVLGYAYILTGKREKASKLLEGMTNPRKRHFSHESYGVALILLGLGEAQKAVKQLEQSYSEGSQWSLAFPFDPILAPLRNNPDYRRFISRVRYPVSENLKQNTLNVF
jgi:hypothetical protein